MIKEKLQWQNNNAILTPFHPIYHHLHYPYTKCEMPDDRKAFCHFYISICLAHLPIHLDADLNRKRVKALNIHPVQLQYVFPLNEL